MSSRKVFTDENGKELSYHLTPEGQLRIKISLMLSTGGSIEGIILDKADALSFIQELNKLRKELK